MPRFHSVDGDTSADDDSDDHDDDAGNDADAVDDAVQMMRGSGHLQGGSARPESTRQCLRGGPREAQSEFYAARSFS